MLYLLLSTKLFSIHFSWCEMTYTLVIMGDVNNTTLFYLLLLIWCVHSEVKYKQINMS